jgi:2'-5' RNA ligase
MGGRFGKYGDLKRRQALQRGRKEQSRLEKQATGASRHRARPPAPAAPGERASAAKTFKTALVIIPPEPLWESIQALRQRYDRRYRRWMPHITLIYPFRPASAFALLTPLLARACHAIAPFEIRLARFDYFTSSPKNASLYLAAEPSEALQALQAVLTAVVPDCDDATRFASGYKPHLSLGQAGNQEAAALCAEWQAGWQPLTFTLNRVCLIQRSDPPQDIFHIGPVLYLHTTN